MAVAAEHEGLAFQGRHGSHPCRLLPSTIDLEVCQAVSFLASIFGGGKYRFGVSHTSTSTFLPSGSPVPLRHASGFPGLGLLWGLRHHGARALEAILNFF